MKNSILVLVMLLLGSGLMAQQIRKCGTMENQARLEAMDPHLAAIRAQIEEQTQQFQSLGQEAVYTIPVVVHVVYNTSAQNVSDAQIQSQITVLNADFRKLNADRTLVPSGFSGVAADCEINFCLATRDPNGNATTGITRTSTSTTSFSDNDNVKRTVNGGKDPWPASSYLNLWVCNMGGGILGYAQFPGGPASTDGVVITYTGFGTTGTAAAPFNKGRTATHEVGHWLNLYHIWGDDGSACTGSDLVGDTPNQSSENYGCPSYPLTDACTSTGNGVMFMNYMDYTDDACMFMFSTGQKTRIQSTMAGTRASLASSLGCAGATSCGNPSALSAGSITGTGATLSWAAVAGATSYNVQYKTSAAPTYTTVTSTTNSKAITGLTGGTTYNWQVQAVCASGSSSYVVGTNFTTTGSCDIYESNNTTGTAFTISAGTAINAQIGSSTDNDYYRIVTTSAAPKIKVALGNLPADYDVTLLNSAGTQLAISQNGGTTSELITYNTPTTGATYYVRVYGYNGAFSTTVCYNLLVSTSASNFRGSDIAEAAVAKDMSGITEDIMQVYPNPTASNLYVSYTTLYASNAVLTVMDLSGRIVAKRDVALAPGANMVDLSVGDLVDGMYIVRVQSASGTRNAKVQVQH